LRTEVAGRQVTASEMTRVAETRAACPVRLKPDATALAIMVGLGLAECGSEQLISEGAGNRITGLYWQTALNDSQAQCSRAGGGSMSVAKVTEISSTSPKSFEDAVQQGLTRASKTIRNIRSAWIKEHQVRVQDGRVTEYQVNMMLTFVLDDQG
jgi:dodecin